MAFLTKIDTSTLSDQNIATALLVHTFTNTTRIRKLVINVHLDQIQGNGAYSIYLTKQLAGAGSFYKSQVTSETVAAAVTAHFFSTITLNVDTSDVVKVYVLGLVTDTTTVDITTHVNEEWIDIDANGRVDVGEWLGVAPAALTATGFYVQVSVLRWLTDNAAGTPLALSTNKVQAVDSNIGTPVALDGGAASIAGMLTKIADDNGGADFNAGTDSLKIISDEVDLLAPGAPIDLTVTENDVVVN